ncbi:hypothetical protein FQP90_11995 [Paenarthrobacter nitroguajacolicus]|uniref:Alpha/beta hydrolase n=1 Tax=Paenarthrobacter nitroguajacolicus TaxID=211146 RepID=A0A558GZQ0_PAENT|nr:hypothetical protein [Paenarthrobacter nitroguajacolicus]TVU62359.1 hypothetical protein FQP90_11995 [Paenarthrobacter nitroguajacolicus]
MYALGDDPFYKVPMFQLESLAEFQPAANDEERIYHVSIGDGMTLSFLTRPVPSEGGAVRVGLHSAKMASTPDDHFFQPVNVLRNSKAAYVAFADPTLTLNPSNRLSWFVGTPRVDPDDWMEAVIRKVLAASAADYVLAEGSSAGGFVSLRLATRFANAIAVPRIAQTDLFRYSLTRPLVETLNTAWSGYSYNDIMAEFPQRFRVADLYTDTAWNRGNLVYYVHNAGDAEHTLNHLSPFLDELGVGSESVKALFNRVVVSRPYTGDGHVGIPSHYWPGDDALALSILKTAKPLGAARPEEQAFVKPETTPNTMIDSAARARTVSWHTIPYF